VTIPKRAVRPAPPSVTRLTAPPRVEAGATGPAALGIQSGRSSAPPGASIVRVGTPIASSQVTRVHPPNPRGVV
jgi:hypothetical protein